MQGGFTIREYASRMRSINVVNCWPFDETLSEETVKSLLPPIVVKRFTWWLDELELSHSETAEELRISQKKTKKVSEKKGETSSRNAGRDSEEAEAGAKAVNIKSLKGKMRATKKRSIVEIFAVAPPVKRAVSEEEEDEEEEEEDDDDDAHCNRATKKKNQKKMKNTDAILRKAMRVVKKIKRKKAAEKRSKENCSKLKLQTQEKATGNSILSCSKEVGNDIHSFVSIPKRKPRQQDFRPYKNSMPCKSSKLIEENQHMELPVRGILKNRDNEFSPKQSKKCISQKANKHVTFSENGEILTLSRKSSQSVECFKLQKEFCSEIGNADYAVAVGKDSTVLEASGSEDASTRTHNELGAASATNEQFATFSVDSTTFGKKNYEGEYYTRSEFSERSAMYSINQHWSDHGLADAPHNRMDMPRDRYCNSPNFKVIAASSNTTRRRLNKDIGTPYSMFPPLCFEDYLRTNNDASMSHLLSMRRAYELTQASSESTSLNSAHSIHFQAFPHLSPNELLQTFCSLPDGSPTGDICGRSINEEFVGLPLNSHGELIALNSCGKREVNQMMNSTVSAAQFIGLSLPSNAVSKSPGHHSDYRNLDSRTSSTGQLNLFPVESYVKENATMAALPSSSGIIESQSEKTNLDLDFLEINYHPFHNPVKTMCRGDGRIQKIPENEKFHSTIRLMGKEFEVGGRGVQGFEDERVWKDKQIIDELHFLNHSISGQNEPSFRQLRETLLCPSEVTVNHRSESKYSLPHFDCQTSSTYKSMFLTRTADCAQKLYPSLSTGTFSEVHNSKSLFSEPYTTGYDQELCFDTSPSAIQLRNKQNLHYSPIPSSIKFPFMHPDLDCHANSSWPRRSSLIQHPLCFDISEKATQLSNSQSCALGCNHPYLNHAASCGTNASVSFRPDDFCSLSPFPSASAFQSVAPPPFPPAPYYSGVLPVSAMQRNQNKIKERIKSRIGVRGIDIGKKSKGRLSPLSNDPFKPFKKPTLGFHEGHQFAIRKPAAAAACISFEDTVRTMEGAAFESHSATKNPRFVTTNDGETIFPWSDSYIENARTAPIKLTAGVKHVLKPCQQKDHSSTRSIDQDISLSATNIGFRFSESENSAKIFQF